MIADLFILILATWRLTSLLSSEAGPYAVLDRLRHWVGVYYAPDGTPVGKNELASGLICPWCLSVWIGLGFGVAWLLWPGEILWIAIPLALSGGAVIVTELLHRSE